MNVHKMMSMVSGGLRGVITSSRGVRTAPSAVASPSSSYLEGMPDQLFSSIELEYRGHDKAVLKSYTKFLEDVCKNLSLTRGKLEVLPYIRWVQPALRSKFVHKKYKLHYETRTHITRLEIKDLTGSTASTFLEYIQRNIPEGVAMKVAYTERLPIPQSLRV